MSEAESILVDLVLARVPINQPFGFDAMYNDIL